MDAERADDPGTDPIEYVPTRVERRMEIQALMGKDPGEPSQL